MAEANLAADGAGIVGLMSAADSLLRMTRGTRQNTTGRTVTNPADMARINELMASITGKLNDKDHFSSLVDSILQRSAIDFAPTRAAEVVAADTTPLHCNSCKTTHEEEQLENLRELLRMHKQQ
jgi:hypothetical protein